MPGHEKDGSKRQSLKAACKGGANRRVPRKQFTQVKYLDVFDEKVTSKGKFYYQKTHKICMEYFRPMDYLIVINGSKLKIVSDGKKSIMNLSSNKMMAQMQDMLTACMIGDLSKMSVQLPAGVF